MTDVLPMDEDAVKSVEKVEKKYRMTKLNQSFTRNITDAEMEDKDANGIMEVLNDVYETMFSTFKNSKMVSYFCMSKQIGNDDHRPHVQGYIQFKRHFPNTEQMKVFWDQHGDVWHSPSKADAQTNVRYTQGKDKDDEDTSEVCWDWKEHGEADCNRIKEKEAGDFFDTFQELGYQAVTKDNVGTAARIHNVCRMAKTAHTFPVELKTKVFTTRVVVLWGPSGSGKSHTARTQWPGAYKVPHPTSSNHVMWWPDYAAEETILFEEFHGQVRFNDMLEICDKWSMRLRLQGNEWGWRNWTTIVFTSTTHPDNWWGEMCVRGAEFKRRLNANGGGILECAPRIIDSIDDTKCNMLTSL